jgi:hypothetical protein
LLYKRVTEQYKNPEILRIIRSLISDNIVSQTKDGGNVVPLLKWFKNDFMRWTSKDPVCQKCIDTHSYKRDDTTSVGNLVLKDWVPLLVNIFQIISSISVVITVVYLIKTFKRAKKADEIKLTESVFKDLRTMEQEYYRPEKKNFNYKDWYSRFFNTFEWFYLLVNKKEIPFNLAKEFLRTDNKMV